MSPDLFVPSAAMLGHYAVISFYSSIAMVLLGLVGKWFGPLIAPGKFTRFCAAVYGFLGDALNHVFKPLLSAKPAAPDASKAGFVTRSLLFVIALASLLFIPIFANGCSGSQTNIGVTGGGTVSPTGDVSWTAGVNIGISLARGILPGIKSAIDAEPSIPAATKAQIDTGFNIGIDSLPLAQTAINTYVQAPTIENRCRIHFYIDQAITGFLQGITVARDGHATVDPKAEVALSTLAALDDVIFPGCQSSGPPMARRAPAMLRVHAAFESR